jgi:alpha-tubulin suppressor-like RCC1 family protein
LDWHKINVGDNNTLAIKKDGSLWAWGWNYDGQLGDGSKEGKYLPTRIGNSNNWMQISSGANHTIAIRGK